MFTTARIFWFLLVILLIAFFAPLFILPFFNHPAADDYICGIHLRREGLLHYQSFIYQNWGGRFAATFTGSLFAEHSFLYSHYYVHSLLLLLLNILSLYFLLYNVSIYLFKEKYPAVYLLLFSLLLTALQYSSGAEPATYLFWLSSAVTYHLPVVLLQFQLGFWLLFFHTKKPALKRTISFLIVLFIIIINGCNELFIITQGLLLIALLYTGIFKKYKSFFCFLVLPAFFISAAFVLLAPGNGARSSLLVSKNLLAGILVVGFHIFEIIWNIGKNPLFWISTVAVYLFANQRKEQFAMLTFLQLFAKRPSLFPIYILLFLVSAIGLAVTGLKGGIVPDRYVNAVISVTLFLFLILSFSSGVSARKINLQLNNRQWQSLLCFVFSICLFANDFFKQEYQSLLSAPLYNDIMTDRETLLKQSAGKETVYISSYDTALKNIIADKYKTGSTTIYNWLSRKPDLLFYTDDLADDYTRSTLAEFYRVKTIVVK